jgi:hypothetical protein
LCASVRETVSRRRGISDELVDVVRQDVGDVALHLPRLSVDVDVGIDGLALTGKCDPPIESRSRAGVVAHVPLAKKAGRVARALQLDRKYRQVVAGPRRVVDDAVGARVLARQQAGSARRAQWRRRKRVQEADAFTCKAIHVRRFDERMPTRREVVPAHVVHQDEDDVGRPGGRAHRLLSG